MGTVPAGREKRAEAAAGPQTFRSPTAVLVWWVWLLFAAANLVDLAVQGRDYASLVAAAILVLATGGAYAIAQRPRIIADDAGITIRNPLRDYHVGWAGVTRVDLTDLLRVHCASSQPGQPDKIISAWAVHYSHRRKFIAETRARRAAARAESRRSSFRLPYGGGFAGGRGLGAAPADPVSAPSEAEAEKIARLLSERATAARAEAVWASGTVPIAGAGPEAGETAAGTVAARAASAGPAARTEVGLPAGTDLSGTGWLEPLTTTWSRSAIAALLIPALILLLVALI